MEVFTLLVGGLIGFLSASAKDFLLEQNKTRNKMKEFKRTKLEEIFLMAEQITQESSKPLGIREPIDGLGAKLGMTIRFYFPELVKDYQTFLNVLLEANQKSMQLNKESIILPHDEMLVLYNAYRVFIDRLVLVSGKYV
jgi:hypothetical protein